MKRRVITSLTKACVLFTCIITVMYILGWVMSDNAALLVPTPLRALLILAFCIIAGFADLLVRGKLKASRTVIHYLICLAAFVLCFLLPSPSPKVGPFTVIAVIVFTVVYAVIITVRAVIYKKKNDGDEPYVSVFGKK